MEKLKRYMDRMMHGETVSCIGLVAHFVRDVNHEVCLLIGKKVVYLTIDTHPLLAMYRETRTERHAASILTFNVFNLFFVFVFWPRFAFGKEDMCND